MHRKQHSVEPAPTNRESFFSPANLNSSLQKNSSSSTHFRNKTKHLTISPSTSIFKQTVLPNLTTTPKDTISQTSIDLSRPRGGERRELSDLLVRLYKNPGKEDMFSQSFVSFRSIATLQKVQPTSVKVGKTETDEAFMPANKATSWKTQLDQNKQQETLFRKTMKEVFIETQTNFMKLAKESERQKRKMPTVKVYTAARFYKDEDAKSIAADAEDLDDIPILETKKTEERVPEYSNRIRVGKDDSYKFYWCDSIDPNLRRPNAREGATMTVIGKNVYLYGGVSKELYNEWEVLNTTTFLWEKLPQKGDIPLFGRLGHVADSYLNGVVIFGGEKNYNNVLGVRECLSDVRFFMPELREWKYFKCQGEFVEPRRNHAGLVVGRHLVIHGGIDTQGVYLNDLKVLNLSTGQWSTPNESGKDNNGIAFHRACLVLSLQRREVNLYRLAELKYDETVQQIKEEGIYFFGGKNEAGEPVSTLRVLKIGATTLKWITPVTQGKSADPRYFHSMVHSKKLNMLIVYGGRNEKLFSTSKSPFLNDFYVLQLENLTWVSVEVCGKTPMGRCSHNAVVLGTKMIVFGGIHYNTYCVPEPHVIEMDQVMVRKLDIQRKNKQKGKSPDMTVKFRKPASPTYNGILSYQPVPSSDATPKRRPKGSGGKSPSPLMFTEVIEDFINEFCERHCNEDILD